LGRPTQELFLPLKSGGQCLFPYLVSQGIIVHCAYKFTVKMAGRSFGSSLVKPAIPGIKDPGGQEVLDGKHAFGNAVGIIKSPAVAAVSIKQGIIMGHPSME